MNPRWSRRAIVEMGIRAACVAISGVPIAAFAADSSADQGRYRPSPYFKGLAFLKRVSNLTHEEFVKRWLEVHVPLVKATPGLIKFRANIIDEKRSQNAPYDGVAEVWYENAQVARESMDGELAAKIKEGRKQLYQSGVAPYLDTTEYVILEPSAGPARPQVKRIGMVPRRAPDMSYAQFVHEWVEVHAPDYMKTTPGIRGYTINVAKESDPSPYGGYASLWWDDQQSYDEAERINKAVLTKQPQNKAPNGAFISAIVEEHVIV